MKKFFQHIRKNAAPRIGASVSRQKQRQERNASVPPPQDAPPEHRTPQPAAAAGKGAVSQVAHNSHKDTENLSSLEQTHANITAKDGVITVPGNVNVAVREDALYIDGKEVKHEQGRDITVIVQGDARNIEYHHDGVLTVQGSTNNVITHYGTVHVEQDVHGFVQTKAGNVQVRGNVGGKVTSEHGMIINPK